MQSIHNFINSETTSAPAYCARLRRLTVELRAYLPSPLCSHVEAAFAGEQYLLLHVDSPVWVVRLRFFQDALLRDWRENFKAFPRPARIDIKVRPRFVPVPQIHAPASLSSAAAESIARSAADIAYAPLREVMQRLAAAKK